MSSPDPSRRPHITPRRVRGLARIADEIEPRLKSRKRGVAFEKWERPEIAEAFRWIRRLAEWEKAREARRR